MSATLHNVYAQHSAIRMDEGGVIRMRRRRLTWRRFEYTMRIPARLSWSTKRAQEFVDYYAALVGVESKPVVFDLATKGRGSRYYGMHRTDRISLSLELDADERWRTLIHEVAHFRYRHDQKKLFLAEIQNAYAAFRVWLSQPATPSTSAGEGEN